MKTTATVAITMKTADAVAAITMEKGNAATMAMALHRKRNKEGKYDIYH